MITAFKIFNFAIDATAENDAQIYATLADQGVKNFFVKHYIYNLVQTVAVIQYSDKRTPPNKKTLQIVCDRLDRLFFGDAQLADVAFTYRESRPLVARIQSRSNQTTPTAAADALLDTAFSQMLCRYENATAITVGQRENAAFIARFPYKVMPMKNYAEYNAEVENMFLERMKDATNDIDDVNQYAPRCATDKIFLCFNTLPKSINADAPEVYTADGANGDDDQPDGIDAQSQAATPPTDDTADGWGDWDVEPQTIDGSPTPSTTDDLGKVAAVLNIERKNINLPARKSAARAQSKHEFNQAAQSLITYTLNNVIKDCLRRIKRGEIVMPTQYFLKFEPREILRAVGVTPSTVQARAVNAAVVTLYETPIKITLCRKTANGIEKRLGYFHFIDYYETDADGNVTLLQISPYILTPGHPVNKAFCRYLPVDKAFNGGTYSIAADCTDVATVVNTLIMDVKPGGTVYWSQIFDTYKFSDSRDRRVKQKILATFAKRGFKVELVGKCGFNFFGTATATNGSPTASTTTAVKTTKTTAVKR